MIEEDVFKIIVPLKNSDQATDQVNEQVTPQASEQATEQAVLSFCKEPKSTHEIMEHIGLRH